MVQGRREAVWGVASEVLAMLANCHKGPKTKSFSGEDFNPTLKEQKKDDVFEVTPDAPDMRMKFKAAFQ
jgi:hypothetical protein